MSTDTVTILRRIDCGGIRQTEEELRYLLDKDDHPLADCPSLIVKLAELERDGLIETEMWFRLTEAGRQTVAGEAA